MQFTQMLIAHPITKGALAGALTAAAIDFQAFRAFKSWHDVATYSWGVASFRWFQGAVIGGLAAAGIGGLVG